MISLSEKCVDFNCLKRNGNLKILVKMVGSYLNLPDISQNKNCVYFFLSFMSFIKLGL